MRSLTPEAYAVIEGRHSDPFHYLGPHVENGSSLLRVFLPDAEGVAVIDEHGHESDLERIHDAEHRGQRHHVPHRDPVPEHERRQCERQEHLCIRCSYSAATMSTGRSQGSAPN